MRRTVIVAVTVVAAAGGVVLTTTGGGDPPAGMAHIWVDPNGGTCADSSTPVEYNDAAACGSLDAANDTCENGDTILIMGGAYPGQTVNGSNGRTATCTMTMAEGQTATLDGELQFSDADRLSFDGGGQRFGVGARLITNEFGTDFNIFTPENRFGMSVSDGDFVTVSGIRAGSYAIYDSRNVSVLWSDIGVCNAFDGSDPGEPRQSGCTNGPIQYCEVGISGCEGYNEGHLIEGNYVHDFDCDISFFDGDEPDGCHSECSFISYARNLTIRGNYFVTCANGGNLFHSFSNGGGTFTADFGFEDYLVENNVFTKPCNNSSTPCGGRVDNAAGFIGHCSLYSGTDFTNVTVRNNTFIGGATWDLGGGCTQGTPGVTFTGNVRGGVNFSLTCGSEMVPSASGNMVNETFYGGGVNSCGTGAQHLGSSTAAIAAYIVSNDPFDPDPHLTGAAGPLDGFVASNCPTHDIDGEARPATNCDAGADER